MKFNGTNTKLVLIKEHSVIRGLTILINIRIMMAAGQRALTQYVSVSSKNIINSCLYCPTEHYKYMPVFSNIIINICLSSKNIYQYMCLSSEMVLSMYLYHLKERDRYVCIISKYISIICKIDCVQNSTTVGHQSHLHHCFSAGGLQTHPV